MLLAYLTKDKKELVGILAHAAVGFLTFVSVYFFVAWFYLVLISAVPELLSSKKRSLTILCLSGYVMSMELLGRVSNAAPFIPYQIGCYFMLLLFTVAMFDHFKSARTHIGFIILLLCVPGFYMISSNDYLTNFLNAFSGILCTGLVSVYFSRQTYTQEELLKFLKCCVLPVVAVLLFITMKSPSLNEMEFSLKANDKTAGGFGSNQVSTILGAAACFMLLPYLRGTHLFGKYKLVGFVLIAMFLFRGLLTFSRGGILGCLSAALISYLYLIFTDKNNMGKSLLRIVFFIVLGFFIFTVTNQVTGGKLSQRYQGETGGTVEGTREKDLKVMTSGRSEIMAAEWMVFQNNLLFGVGPGNGYEARKEYVSKMVASHTEVTRLISEQGLPGLFLALIFLLYPFRRIAKAKSREERYYLIAFFALAVITSFHSSMRTMLTPVLWGIGCAGFSFPQKTLSKPAIPHQRSTAVRQEAAVL